MNNKEYCAPRERNITSEHQSQFVSLGANTVRKDIADNHSKKKLSQCGLNIAFWEGVQFNDETLEFFLRLRDVIMTQHQKLKKYKSKYRSKQKQLQQIKYLLRSQKGILREGCEYAKSDSISLINNERVKSSDIVESELTLLQYETLRVEAVTTFHELEFLKTEHVELKGVLDDRNEELQSMANKLQSCQEEIATLELERELSGIDISHIHPTSQSQCNVESKRASKSHRFSPFAFACLRRQIRNPSDGHCGMGVEVAGLPSPGIATSKSDTVTTHVDNKAEMLTQQDDHCFKTEIPLQVKLKRLHRSGCGPLMRKR